MKKYLSFLCLSYLVALLAACTAKTEKEDANELPYNPYVEAFTYGKISRYSPVYLIFNEDISPDKIQAAEVSKRVRIRPETAGRFEFENNRTLVFKPSKGFERNTEYRVTADLSDWFEVKGKDKDFTFAFSS